MTSYYLFTCRVLVFFAMRTLELLQPFFLPHLNFDIFFIFPPSYVVSKLSYSQRAFCKVRHWFPISTSSNFQIFRPF